MKRSMRMLGGCAVVLGVLLRPIHRIRCRSKARACRHVDRGDNKEEQRVVIEQTAEPIEASTLSHKSSSDSVIDAAVQEVEPNGETASVNSFRLDNIDKARFISLPTVSIEGGRAVILPDLALAASLRAGLLAHRRVKTVEDDINAEIAIIGPRFLQLQQEIEGLEPELTASDPQVNDGLSAPTAAMDKISALREEKDLIFDRQLTLRGMLQESYADLRAEQMEMLDMLDGCLFTTKEQPSHINADLPVNAPIRSAFADDHFEIAPQTPVNGAVSTVVKGDAATTEERDTLLYNMHIYSSQLSFVEKQLEYRDNVYYVEREQGRMPPAGGTEADLIEFQRTRELTQDIVAAERDYDEAKAACRAAGIQAPGSRVESGFVDDVEDGYRISLENDLVASLDVEGIRRWLQGVEAAEAPMMTASSIANINCQSDAWDAQEVGMSDSWSMVADGAQKRRIEKCREQEDAIRKAITSSCMEG